MKIEINKNDPRNTSSEDFDYLVYLRIFEGCNLHCEHCFIPANPKKMTMEQIHGVPDQISKIAPEGSKVLIQWHGGEPTAMGAKWFREAISYINANAKFKVEHGIQTNLMNYNEAWRDIFRDFFDSSIGVSWDPEIRLMKAGKPETNLDFEIKFWKNIDLLLSDGIKPYLVVTGTKVFFNKFRNPMNFFKMMEDKGISHVHIERLTKTGYARNSWEKIGVDNLEWSNFMLRFAKTYKIYCNKPRKSNQPFNLSPLDGMNESVERLLNGESGGYGCLSGACDTRFHTIDANGYKGGCTALNSESDNKSVAGGQVVKFFDFRAQRKIRQVDCASCQFKPICSSGCLASDKMDESLECSGGYKLFDGLKKMKS